MEKRSLRWYGLIEERGEAMKECTSFESDRRMKDFWSGGMELNVCEGRKEYGTF